jgi:hypothetical protein
MKPPKPFDCVQMKWEIQQRLLNELQPLSPEESRRTQQQRIAADPLLGPFLQKVPASVRTPANSRP